MSKLRTFYFSQPYLMTSVGKLTISQIQMPISDLMPICPDSLLPHPQSLPSLSKATEQLSEDLTFLIVSFSSFFKQSKYELRVGMLQFLFQPSPNAPYYPVPQLQTFPSLSIAVLKCLPQVILQMVFPYKALILVGFKHCVWLPWPNGPVVDIKILIRKLLAFPPQPKEYSCPFSSKTIECLSPHTTSLIFIQFFQKYQTRVGAFTSFVCPCPSQPFLLFPKVYTFL